MTKRVQEINFNFGLDQYSKFLTHKKSMPTVRCDCGFEILVLPDLKAMSIAIKNHVAEHKKARVDPKRISELGPLTELLTEQVLIRSSEINL